MKLNSWLILGAAAVIVGGGGSCYLLSDSKDTIKWRTAKIERKSIRQRVSATGTLSAILQVDVGTQVSGLVTSLNADFNSIVTRDQIIATIDTTIPYQQVRTEEINVERTKTSLDDAERQYKRYQVMSDQKLVSATDLESREVSYRTAKAQYDNAVISLEKAKSNLDYCTIKAPVDGVVVSRKADVGQTVTASMTTPSLFIIAQDLSKMKLEVTIDEADISQIAVGQRASFTVDSFAGTQFSGMVSQVRLEPVVNQNVVSYKVVVEVQNQTRQEIEAQRERRQNMALGAGSGMGGGRGESQGQPNAPVAAPDANAKQTTLRTEPQERSPQAGPGERRPGGPGGEERPRGGFFMGGDGTVDYDTIWERRKDSIQERQPGITKEAWIQQMKESRSRMEQQGGGAPMLAGGPGSRRSESPKDTINAAPSPMSGQRNAQPVSTSGIIKSGGPFYQGDYVLRPGMTANVTIVTNQRDDVLSVPGTALRFTPSNYIKDETKPAQGQTTAQTGQTGTQQRPQQGVVPGGMFFGGPAPQQDRRARLMDRGFVSAREDRVWILDEKGKPKSITVKAGINDGQSTEISGEGISEGMEILIGVEETKKSNAPAGGSPFQMGGTGVRR
ncbi:MAG: efflux RND transporter periplasmic adaptor subunit [Holophagales bacterium]|nr:efflux RND transporter periplasmic adaptor subunit [Holophagales bacterium]